MRIIRRVMRIESTFRPKYISTEKLDGRICQAAWSHQQSSRFTGPDRAKNPNQCTSAPELAFSERVPSGEAAVHTPTRSNTTGHKSGPRVWLCSCIQYSLH